MCDRCGAFVKFPEEGEVTCSWCLARVSSCALKDMEEEVVTVGRSRAKPAWLRAMIKKKREEEASGRDRRRAVVKEECPKCGNKEMEFYTLQIRSVDEVGIQFLYLHAYLCTGFKGSN